MPEDVGTTYPEPVAVVGDIGSPKGKRARVRVSVHEGRFGRKIDIREFLDPPRIEDTRIRAGRKAGATLKQKEPYVGPTRVGWRLDLEDALTLANLIFEAGGIAEQKSA